MSAMIQSCAFNLVLDNFDVFSVIMGHYIAGERGKRIHVLSKIALVSKKFRDFVEPMVDKQLELLKYSRTDALLILDRKRMSLFVPRNLMIARRVLLGEGFFPNNKFHHELFSQFDAAKEIILVNVDYSDLVEPICFPPSVLKVVFVKTGTHLFVSDGVCIVEYVGVGNLTMLRFDVLMRISATMDPRLVNECKRRGFHF